MTEIVAPFAQFFDTSGAPLANGAIYIGIANLDAESNPIAVFWDDALTIPAAQPIRTLNGYPVWNGAPSRLYANVANYSITVRNAQNRLLYSAAYVTSATLFSDPNGSSLVGFIQAGANAVARTAQDKMRDVVSVKDFGALGNGLVDDAAAIQAAINAMPANGGGLYFPAGTYLIGSAVILNKAGVYFGDGWATNIRTTSATANSFLVTGAEQVHIEKMRFTSAVAKTAGWYVDIAASANRFRLSDFAMEGAIGGVRSAAVATVTIERGQILNSIAGSGVQIKIDAGFDVSIRDILSDQALDTFAGVYITQAGDVTIEDCNFIHCGQALYVNPQSGQVIASIWANNTFFDTSSRAAYLFAQGGTIVRSLFDQCWFSGSTNEGVRLETSGAGIINGTDFNGCQMFLNSFGVAIITPNVTNTRVHDCAVAQNTFAGIYLEAGVGDASIQDCRIGATHGLIGNATGILLAAGAGNNIQILNNDLRGNTINLSNAATGASVIVANNLGANEAWTNYTPTVGVVSGTITTLGAISGRYQKINKQLFISVAIAITTNGTGAVAVTATLPTGLTAASDQVLVGRENSITGNQLQGVIFAGAGSISITRYDNAYPGGNGHRLLLTGVIEVQ